MNVALLLLDIRLPACLGTELIEQMRHFDALEHTPAVAVTSEPGFNARGTGFMEVWRKPLSTREVAIDHDAPLVEAARGRDHAAPSLRTTLKAPSLSR